MKNYVYIIILLLLVPQFQVAQENPTIHQLEYENNLSQKLNKISNLENSEEIIPLNKSVTKNLTHSVFGFYPDWEYQKNAHNNFDYNLLTHVAAFDFTVSSNGQISDPWGWPWTSFINEAHTNGVKVIMVVVNFEANDINKIMTNSFSRWAFMLGVQSKIKRYNLDGVNIDFEGLNMADRGSLINEFMQELTDSVHSIRDDLEVSFASPAVNWGGWELNGLANSCDYLFIMGYDFYGSWSSTTGPTAPLVSNSSYNITNTLNVEYANISRLSPHKLILGVPYFSPHWKTSSASEGASITGWVGSERFFAAQQESESHGLNWSTTYKNAWYSFIQGGEHHQVWFDDDVSLALKYNLAINKKLKGIGMWALGYDKSRDELWNLIEEKFSQPVDVEKEEIISNNFELKQNFPNPFNPVTTIKYRVQSGFEGGKVLLKIYDVLGREIKTLVNKIQSAGNYQVDFNASDLPSSIYYYQLISGDFVQTKKMILLK